MDILTFYQNDTSSNKPKRITNKGGQFTKTFLKYNKDLIKKGLVFNYIDPFNVYNPQTNRTRRIQFDKRTRDLKPKKSFIKKFNINQGIIRPNIGRGAITGTIPFMEADDLGSKVVLKNILKSNGITGNIRIVMYLKTQSNFLEDDEEEYSGEVLDNTFNLGLSVNKWWKKEHGKFILGDYEDMRYIWNYGDTKYIISKETKLKLSTGSIKQYFRDGKNYYCFYSVVLDWLYERLEKTKSKDQKSKILTDIAYIEGRDLKSGKRKYGILDQYNGALPEDENIINNICNRLRIGIDIEQPFMKDKYIHIRPLRATKKVFKFVNSRLNHIEPIEENGIFNNLYQNNIKNVEYLEREDLKLKINQLEKNDTCFIYGKDSWGVNTIKTNDKFYSLNTDFNLVCQEWEEEQGFTKNMFVDYNKDYNLTNFINNGTHYNGVIDFQDTKNLNVNDPNIIHDDLEKAYTRFKDCKYYSGFMGVITHSLRPINNHNHKGLYKIENLILPHKLELINNKMNIYFNGGIYYDSELHFLEENGASFRVVEGIVGERFDFEFNEDMKNKKDYVMIGEQKKKIPYYSKWTGKCGRISLNKNFYMKGKKEYFENLDTEATIWETDIDNEFRITYEKNSVKHRKHIAGQITTYMRINMISHILNMDIDKLIRICVDGIYYYKHDHKRNPIFHYNKDKKPFEGCGVWDSYISMCCESDYFNYSCLNKKRDYHRLEAHIGGGGCGKTHFNLLDKGLYNPCYIAPSWKLSTSKGKEYNIPNNVLARFTDKQLPYFKELIDKYNNLIIDECSMITENQKKFLIDNFKGGLIFCGDIGFQLDPPNSLKAMNTDNLFIVEYKKCYRFKCRKLEKIIYKIRDIINEDHLIDKVSKSFKNISYEEVKKLYTNKDLIITYTHNAIDKIDKDITYDKFRIMNNTRLYKNGEIVLKEPKINGVEYERHNAFTIHSIQGETTDNKLFIDLYKMKSMKMIYTALSRARRYEQIYFFNSNL